MISEIILILAYLLPFPYLYQNMGITIYTVNIEEITTEA
jgi:hypothetical protein